MAECRGLFAHLCRVESAANDIAAGLDLPVAAVEGELVSIPATALDPQVVDGATYEWEVNLGATVVTAGTSSTVNYTPPDNGSYAVTM